MGADTLTLFAANAVVLVITAFAFLAAWCGQRREVYWGSWIAANCLLATALVLFMFASSAQDGTAMTAANVLLVAGFGLRWRAARQFGGRSGPHAVILLPTLFVAILFAFPAVFSHGMVYMAVNAVLAVTAAAIVHEFWRDRADGLPSRYGLVLAYVVIGLSFAARAVQGVLLDQGIASYLPQDAMLQIHLVVALFHATASGAFALSIAYERGAIALREAALRDPLTDLHNRRAFEMHLDRHLLRRGSGEFALMIFDIDHFKRVNDRYGHAAGDAALRACAQACVAALRPADFVARIGGEEFAVLLPGVTVQGAFDAADRVRRAVGQLEIAHGGNRFGITLSAGIAHGSTVPGNLDDLMSRADAGLYRAKKNGRNAIGQAAA